MPRIGRLHLPGGCYHVMGRGLERRRIFNADEDKREFFGRLGEYLERSEAQCLAWAVMSNHYHLLVRIGCKPLSKLMSPLLGGYAGYYNRRRQRSGYVFQNRYKSILCDAEDYLLEFVRYIHLNPLRAGIVTGLAALDRYPWTGHAVLMGRREKRWQTVDDVLGLFAKRIGTARIRYSHFIADGLHANDRPDLSGGGLVRSCGGWEALKQLRKEHAQCIGDERILGDNDFVERALAEDELAMGQKTRRLRQGWTIGRLSKAVCNYCEIDERQLTTKARANSLSVAKSLICYWGAKNWA